MFVAAERQVASKDQAPPKTPEDVAFEDEAEPEEVELSDDELVRQMTHRRRR